MQEYLRKCFRNNYFKNRGKNKRASRVYIKRLINHAFKINPSSCVNKERSVNLDGTFARYSIFVRFANAQLAATC